VDQVAERTSLPPKGAEPVFVTGLVLAAGGSRRLGEPKQLLPFRGRTLLDASLDQARAVGFDQLLVTLGGAAEDVRAQVDLTGVEVVSNPAYGEGCSSSIAAALPAVDPRSAGLVLLLGDQPGVRVDQVRALMRTAAADPGCRLAVSRYTDGRGHPFWFARSSFGDLARLHGDKGVWRLLESQPAVLEVPAAGEVPVDVDSRADYEALLALDRASLDQASLDQVVR
jgi:molybdenum cofactor cytidylyltransferase